MDHKVTIKISLNAYGLDSKYEWWVNFDREDTPREVAEWLLSQFELAKDKASIKQREKGIE